MKLVVITGIAGFIASNVAKKFLDEGYNVIGLDDLSSGYLENIPEGVDFINCNLACNKFADKLPSNCNLILHLAGQSSGAISFDDPVSDLNKNTASTLNLIQYGLRAKCDRFVYASSMSVYGDAGNCAVLEDQEAKPLSCYGVSKLASERYLSIYKDKLPFTSMRMFNVYGAGQDLTNLRQGMVSIYVAQAVLGGHIKVEGSINRYRDFIYIDDVVSAWFNASVYPESINETINIGTGRKTTVEDLLRYICLLIPESSYSINGTTLGDQTGIYADITKFKNILKPPELTYLDVGLPIFVNWAKENLSQTILTH